MPTIHLRHSITGRLCAAVDDGSRPEVVVAGKEPLPVDDLTRPCLSSGRRAKLPASAPLQVLQSSLVPAAPEKVMTEDGVERDRLRAVTVAAVSVKTDYSGTQTAHHIRLISHT